MVRFTWIIGSLASTPYYSQHLFGLQECVLGRAHHAVFLALSFTLKCSPLSHNMYRRVPRGISGHRALPDSRLYRDVMDAFDLAFTSGPEVMLA